MKFTQPKFHEKQSEGIGRRGIDWHISCVISRKDNRLEVTSYAHLFNSCTQDWFSVLSIIENLMSLIIQSNLGITKAYMRSDEAGCYHNSSLIASLRDIGDRQGIKIVRCHHSEPQYGKDFCNRNFVSEESRIRHYCHEGHNIITTHDMQIALDKRPVQGTTAAVFCVNEEKKNMKMKKIANSSSQHKSEFTSDDLWVWKTYNIGAGNWFHGRVSDFVPRKQQASWRKHRSFQPQQEKWTEQPINRKKMTRMRTQLNVQILNAWRNSTASPSWKLIWMLHDITAQQSKWEADFITH